MIKKQIQEQMEQQQAMQQQQMMMQQQQQAMPQGQDQGQPQQQEQPQDNPFQVLTDGLSAEELDHLEQNPEHVMGEMNGMGGGQGG
jgi:hypothetical protein